MTKKLTLSLAILAMAGVSYAQTILVPNGDFSAGSTSWQEVSGGGAGASYTYPSTGGNPDGYGQIDSTAGAWAIWVANMGPEVIDLSYFGVSAGDTITVTMDMIEFSNGGGNTAGIKMESWNAAVISDSGDMKVAVGSTWDTYTWEYTIAPGATGIKFVPVQHDELSIGYDNIGIVAVPEPSTFALLGGILALGFVMYRRRK